MIVILPLFEFVFSPENAGSHSWREHAFHKVVPRNAHNFSDKYFKNRTRTCQKQAFIFDLKLSIALTLFLHSTWLKFIYYPLF